MPDPSSTPTNPAELDALLGAAVAAAPAWGALSPRDRAEALRAVAGALDDASNDLVPLAQEESHLAEGRLRGELVRTTTQLRLFADVLDDGAYLGVVVDHPDPRWPSGPRPDLRRMLVAIGPTVVFGAGNFPFAFSVAGGDTASALAAGCPVVHKAHPGHLRLAARTARIVVDTLGPGLFALVVGDEAGRAAVTDERVQAAAFTGSLTGGRALFDLAAGRPSPIPFYGELGSLNPVFVTAAAAEARKDEILAGYVASFTLGAGQFCTKPGLLFVPTGTFTDADLAATVATSPAAPLLNERIASGFTDGLERLTSSLAIRTVMASSRSESGVSPSLLATTVSQLLANRDDLLQECFGPVSLVVTYDDEAELIAAAEALEGQLTASVHGEKGDSAAARLLETARQRAGRVLWNEWPTGVSVTWAMHHGGPYPATTSPLHTSVGTTAIDRFLRPVTYQSVPDELLPPALQEANPLRLTRRVDGRLEIAPVPRPTA